MIVERELGFFSRGRKNAGVQSPGKLNHTIGGDRNDFAGATEYSVAITEEAIGASECGLGGLVPFGATLGILLIARPIAGRLRKPNARGGRIEALLDAIISLFAATVAAELALMPVSAAVFSQVSVAGLALNFIAIPAMAVVA